MQYKFRELKKWGRTLDKITQIIGIIVYIMCVIFGIVVLINMFGFLDTLGDAVTLKFTLLGNPINYQELSQPLQIAISLFMIVMLIFVCIMTNTLVKALREIFGSIANGRPFEDSTVKGLRKAALWTAILGVLSGKISGIVIAVLFLFLSYIFHYGMLLQQESDETL